MLSVMRLAITILLGLAVGALAFVPDGESSSVLDAPAPVYRTRANARAAARGRLIARGRSWRRRARRGQAAGR